MKLSIDLPSGAHPILEYGCSFDVQGKIVSEEPLPRDAILTVRLFDADGRLLRCASQAQKNNNKLYLAHPDLTGYPDEMDPDKEGIREFGFPELLVRDPADPMGSLSDATIKCWYSDDCFKAVIVSGTDSAHGRIFDDGIGFRDENGEPYGVLEIGEYILSVELCDATGEVLAKAEKGLSIGETTDQAIVRFNPPAHRQRMEEWCRDNGLGIIGDTLPGYLEPYKGVWLYHMGLLPMYRANDIEYYKSARIHMFVYLVDPTSTSYETELAYLQSRGIVGDPEKFFAYHYDIGEAVIGKGREYEKHGRIMKFEKDEYLYICRVDIVNKGARENCFDLSEESVVSTITDLHEIVVSAGTDIAITGVVRPWQLSPASFSLKHDNTYEISDSVCAISYEFDDGVNAWEERRKLLMERIDGHSIGTSVFEFYNIFSIDSSLKGRDVSVRITACDRSGEKREATAAFTLMVR